MFCFPKNPDAFIPSTAGERPTEKKQMLFGVQATLHSAHGKLWRKQFLRELFSQWQTLIVNNIILFL